MSAPTTLQCAKCGATLPPIPGYERSTWRHCPCGHVAVAKRADDPPFSETTSGQYAGKRAPTIQKGTRCGCHVDSIDDGIRHAHSQGCPAPAVRLVRRIYLRALPVPMCAACADYHSSHTKGRVAK